MRLIQRFLDKSRYANTVSLGIMFSRDAAIDRCETPNGRFREMTIYCIKISRANVARFIKRIWNDSCLFEIFRDLFERLLDISRGFLSLFLFE